MADLIPPLFKSPEDYRLYFIEEVENGRIPRDPVGAQEKQGMHNAFKGKKSGPIIKQKHSNLLKEAEKIDDIANRRTESPKSTTRILSLKDLAFDNRAGEGTPKQPTQRNLFDDSSPTQPRLPTPQATEEEPVVNAVNPNQQSFSFGETAQDFRSDAEVQKELLTKIFDTLFDISKNVSLMAEGFPDLLEASKSVDKLKDTNNLKKEEEDRESLGKRLKGTVATNVIGGVGSIFGTFEKILAILTPLLLGLVVSFMDLTDPLELLQNALTILSAFLVGKFIYQLGKALTMSLVSKLLFPSPKIINAPNSIINSGAATAPIGGTGDDTVVGAPDEKDKQKNRDKPGSKNKRRKNAIAAKAGALKGKIDGTPVGTTAASGVPVGGAAGVADSITPAGSGARTTATARALGGIKTFGRGFLPLALLSSLVAAPSLYFQKRDEGKGRFRAGAEATAGVGGGLLGGVLTGAATGAALGALGANPFTIALGGAIGAVAGGIMGEQVASSFTEKVFNFFGGEPFGGTAEEGFLFSPEFAKMSAEQRNQINISSKDYDEFNKRFGITPISQLKTEELEQVRKDITAKEPEPPKDGNFGSFMTQFNQQTSVQNRFTGKMEAESAPHQCGLGSNLSKS